MKTRIFKIFCLGDKERMYNDTAKNLLNEMFSLPRNEYVITIQEVTKYTKSRYKFYWAHVLLTAVTQFNERGLMQCKDKKTGKTYPLDTFRLHNFFKREFNSVLEEFNGEYFEVEGSTRQLDDHAFISEYLEKIFQWLVERDVIVMEYDDWCLEMKHGATCQTLANSIHY